jgi:peptidyl-prolyl cis-trans isomerase A (cyclophilin A)
MVLRHSATLLLIATVACGSTPPDTAASRRGTNPDDPSRAAQGRTQGPASAAAVPETRPEPVPAPSPAPAAQPDPATAPAGGPVPVPTVDEARLVLEGMKALAEVGNPSALVPYVSRRDRGFLHRTPDEIRTALSGRILGGHVEGGRVVVDLEPFPVPAGAPSGKASRAVAGRASAKGAVVPPPPQPKPRYAVMLRRPMGFRYDPGASETYAPPDPGVADPLNVDLSLKDATADLPGTGRLVADIETSEGRLTCGLFPDQAPRAVAAFVGLARGRRAFLDPETKAWTKRPCFDDQPIHQATPGLSFSFGCTGRDEHSGVGFSVPDELDVALRHDLPGRLGLDNGDRPNQGAARLYVTAAPDPERDDRNPILGQCGPLDVITKITHAGGHETRPGEAATIRRITIRREEPPKP